MPLSQGNWGIINDNYLLWDQLFRYDPVELARKVAENTALFNDEQRNVYNTVMDSVRNNKGETLFVHSAGGGGKTFVCNTIAAAVREMGKVALCVASSGIASLLLDGGRTAHSRFKIPIDLNETSKCRFGKNHDLYTVLQRTGIIIWDEAPMQHKHAVEALDRTLREVMGVDKCFGGITVLFGGDFRQTLPVVPKGTRQEIVAASLKRSNRIWRHTKVLHLRKNMRLDRTPESEAFAKWLLDVGSGKNVDNDGKISLPEHMQCGADVDSLVQSTYPGVHIPNQPDQYYLDRTILSGTNDDVDKINAAILQKFPGEETVLMSADSVSQDDEASHLNFQPYPMEFLNSITASGLPLAKLALKPGCPLMLLHNLDPSKGLCNGTRLILVNIRPHVLECRIITGDERFAGKHVLIPRLVLEPSNDLLPVKLRRHQFPVRLAFAMTINKSQGQSVKNVGLDLRSSVFSHGQLYVALSWCTSGNRIKVLFPEIQNDTHTHNVVYNEILPGVL